MSVIPKGASEGGLGNLEVFGCSKICFLLYLYVELQNYEVWIAGKIIAQTGSNVLQLASRSKFLQLGSRSSSFNLDPDPSCFNLDPGPSCFNLDPDPSFFNLGLGTYCTLPSKILYNPNIYNDKKKVRKRTTKCGQSGEGNKESYCTGRRGKTG